MASFGYRDNHRPCYSDPELIPSTAQGYKVAEKLNRPSFVLNSCRMSELKGHKYKNH